ncbi:hypothetical protein CHISP_3716 [Chitinispirillum alkaliphilum]|nr:hypothetical protein CHISP_3716 [Chitinispirillum alkaliphilum]
MRKSVNGHRKNYQLLNPQSYGEINSTIRTGGTISRARQNADGQDIGSNIDKLKTDVQELQIQP